MRLLLAILALGLGLPGCEDDTPAAGHPDGPLVTYEHGGGIAAQPRRLVIDRDGHARLATTTGTTLSHRRFDLSPTQLADLEDELADARGDTDPDQPGGCADCFTFSIEADDIDVDLDQVSIEAATDGLRRLVATLERLSA